MPNLYPMPKEGDLFPKELGKLPVKSVGVPVASPVNRRLLLNEKRAFAVLPFITSFMFIESRAEKPPITLLARFCEEHADCYIVVYRMELIIYLQIKIYTSES